MIWTNITDSTFAAVFDALVTFEGTGFNYSDDTTTNFNRSRPPSYLDDFGAGHFAHIVHSETNVADIALARTRKEGMIYLTDDARVPNPFDRLASYFVAEAAAWAPTPTGFYVSSAGNDLAVDGSFTNPWASVQHALEEPAVGAGSTIYIRGGTYTNKVDFPKSGAPCRLLTVRNFPGESVILDGGSILPVDGPLINIEAQS